MSIIRKVICHIALPIICLGILACDSADRDLAILQPIEAEYSDPPWNPTPAIGAAGQTMDVMLNWNTPDSLVPPITYSVYFGADDNPPVVDSNLTDSVFLTGWEIQAEAVKVLRAIQAAQDFHYNFNGHYWGAARVASSVSPSAFSPIGVVIMPGSMYTYTMTTGDQTDLLVTATCGYLDWIDPIIDCWTIDENADLRCTSNDCFALFEEFGTYFWRVEACDSLGRIVSSPIWNFTTGEYPHASNGSVPEPVLPFPSNGAENWRPTRLKWSSDIYDLTAERFDIYIGTDSMPSLYISDCFYQFIDVSHLERGERYFWQVVAINFEGETNVGPIWTFTTTPNRPPYTPALAVPYNNATNVGQDTLLYWSCGDPDIDDLTYDLYFGTRSNPRLAVSGLTDHFYDPGWKYRYDVKNTLAMIYAAERAYFRNNGIYTGQGEAANASNPDGLTGLGVAIPGDSRYTYTIVTADSHDLLIEAVCTDLDDDETADIWQINENAQVRCTSNDLGCLFSQGEEYFWSVRATDSTGDESCSDTWSFTAAEFTGLSEPSNLYPPKGAVDVPPEGITLSWQGTGTFADGVHYEVWVSTVFFEADVLTPSYATGPLMPNRTYIWRVYVRCDDQIRQSETYTFRTGD